MKKSVLRQSTFKDAKFTVHKTPVISAKKVFSIGM